MSIFNFFKKESSNDAAMAMPLVIGQQEMPVEASQECETDVDGAQPGNRTLTVTYATGWPIDVIYGYLHKNYEEKGFDDAMIKSDLAFRDINMDIIRNKILMVFREVNLNYDVMQRDLESRIETCSAAGLLTTLYELEKQAAIINAHKAELQRLENDFRSNSNEASVPLQSYECGFLRGVATIALSNSGSAPKVLPATVTPPVNSQRATA